MRWRASLALLALPILVATGCNGEREAIGMVPEESEEHPLTTASPIVGEATAGEATAGEATAGEATAALATTPAPIAVDVGTSSKQTVWVFMKDKASLAKAAATADWKARGRSVYDALWNTANQSQASLRTLLAQKNVKYSPFWVVNALKVEADAAIIQQIAQRPDVAQVVQDRRYQIPPLLPGTMTIHPTAIEWGVANIRAPEVWSSFGSRGEGIVVANIDTGVEYKHPALARQYRGSQADGSTDHNYNWYDPTSLCGAPTNGPCDNVGHGTHTMGTMVGDDGDPGANQIGVAPHARWIAAKGCEYDNCTADSLMRAAQWILAPTDTNGLNPRPDLRPNIVNNSWGGGNGDTFFQAVVQAWVSAGIFPSFSIGNMGSMCGSANSPGDLPESYAAGAYDQSLTIAPWSSRGPSAFGIIKPNLTAPGVNVRSSIPGGTYGVNSGTSMASPHLSGTVALMWAAAPSLVGDVATTRALLDQASLDTEDLSCRGDAANNNVWGQGRLDAFAVVSLAPVGPTGTLQGTVTDVDGNPVAGATVLIQGGPRDRSVPVAADGSYQTRLGAGVYTVTARAFGFVDVVANDVAITQDAVTVQNFNLTRAPSFALSGVVRSTAGAAMAGALVTVVGTPLPPAIADAGGHYSFPVVPAGNYQVRAEGTPCFAAQSSDLVLGADTSLDFALPQRGDGYGYSCLPATYAYVEANTVLPLRDYATTEVTLPFPFTFYGRTYEKANVASGGYLSFMSGSYIYGNSAIPDPAQPNAALYPFWDELYMQPDSSVRTELLGTAPRRQFVIEWRNVVVSMTNTPVSFEVILFENGPIQMQYVSGNDPSQQGLGATIGIENEAGTMGFQYSYNQASVTPQSSVIYSMPPSGIVQGTLTDGNDHTALGGATVEVKQGDTVIASTLTTPSGFYRLFLPAGSHTLVASMKSYEPAQATVSVAIDEVVQKDFALKTGAISLSPGSLQLLMPIGQSRTRTLTLKNTGSSAISYTLAESGGRKLAVTPTRSMARTMGFNAAAFNTKGLFPGWSTTANIGIDATGDVLKSFVPAGLSVPWGVGFTGNLWLSDPPVNQNTEFTVDGAATGLKWPTPWAGQWGADMTTDTTRGTVCQLGVGSDNGIHCWTPANGVEADKIVGNFPWTATSQRGLAYRPDDDSFYVGGWNDGTIYHIKGLAAPDKGTVISSCRPADGNISGLAFNSAVGVLWVATNSPTDTIYELNPDDCTVLSTLAHPSPGFNGAGLDMDEEGNLWTVSQNGRTVYLLDSGVPAFSDVTWLSETPATGVVAPGKTVTIAVKVNTTGLAAGVYLAGLYLQSTAGKQPLVRIPVSLVVTSYQQGVVAGGSAYTDGQGDLWAADRAYGKGPWGYVQRSRTTSTSKRIAGTSDQPLFKSQRIDPYAYRFDNVPNGIYQVDLNFAELMGARMGKRLYDVIVENTLVLPAHDIVYEVGTFAADKHVVFVEVIDGQMDVRLIPRAGSEAPVINSLRVTHRPDR